ARVCLREERQRLVIVGAGRIGDPIGSGVPDLPAAGGELPQPAPRLALARAVLLLRRAHHALRWTLVDGSGPPCPSVPLAPDGGRNPRAPAGSRPASKLRRARRGTTSRARQSRIPLRLSPRLHSAGTRVPSACPIGRLLVFISVLLCLVRKGTKRGPELR